MSESAWAQSIKFQLTVEYTTAKHRKMNRRDAFMNKKHLEQTQHSFCCCVFCVFCVSFLILKLNYRWNEWMETMFEIDAPYNELWFQNVFNRVNFLIGKYLINSHVYSRRSSVFRIWRLITFAFFINDWLIDSIDHNGKKNLLSNKTKKFDSFFFYCFCLILRLQHMNLDQ